MQQRSTKRKPVPAKSYFVEITIDGKGSCTYFFKTRDGKNGAATFFYLYCKQMGIDCSPLLPRHTWAREKGNGITVDFETISDLQLQSIFDLN